MIAMQPEGGVISLVDAGIVVPRQAIWYRVASRTRRTASPCELRIDVDWPSDVLPASTASQFPRLVAGGQVGQQNLSGSITWESQVSAALRITYGSQGVNRTLVCDLRSMRLNLGSCDYVTVEAMRWRQTAWVNLVSTATVVVGADISDATGGQYDEPTSTHVATFAAAAAIARSMYIPAHARWFSPITSPNALPPPAYWGGTDPDITFAGGVEAVVISPAYSRRVPAAARYELIPGVIFLDVSTQAVVLVNAQWVGARFWLCC